MFNILFKTISVSIQTASKLSSFEKAKRKIVITPLHMKHFNLIKTGISTSI